MVSGLVFAGLMGCEDIFIKPNQNQEGSSQAVEFRIRKGEHDSNHLPAFKQDVPSLKFQAKFDSSAIYRTSVSKNQADINKLYGLSDCNSPHQENSARFGWRWHDNELQILAYTYTNKVRSYKLLGFASLNAFHSYEIEFTKDEYVFSFDDKTVTLPRSCPGNANGYRLYPYFGGDEVAPHDVVIWIKDL
jgi:hypothetical protein